MSPTVPVQDRPTRARIIDCVVVVVGGGPAGLAAAVQLGRLRASMRFDGPRATLVPHRR